MTRLRETPSHAGPGPETHDGPGPGAPRPAGERRLERLTTLIPLAILVAGAAAYLLVPAVRDFVATAWTTLTSGDRARIERWTASFGGWGPAVILGAMMLQALVAVVPSTLIMVVAVLAYGPTLGGLLAWAGPVLAATVNYGVGRAVGTVTVDAIVGRDTELKVRRFVERYGFWAIVLARAAPAVSDDAFSLVAGAVAMRFPRYLLASVVGVFPLAATIAFLGGDIDRLKTGLLWGSIATAVLFVAYVVYDHHRRDERPGSAEPGR